MTDLITQKSELHGLVAESDLPETEKKILDQLVDDCSDMDAVTDVAKKILDYAKSITIKSADEYLETLQRTKEFFAIGQQMVSRRKENPEASIDDLLVQMEALKPYFE